MMSIFLTLWSRLSHAVTTLPSYDALITAAVAMTVYGAIAILIGFRSKFLSWDVKRSKLLFFKVVTTSLIAPALLEETLFRVLLLPTPVTTAPKTFLIWSIFSLALFVMYHPLNALTFFPQARDIFSHPVFLVLAAGLGGICNLTYWQTGSLWLPVIVHWLVVVLWLLCFGGFKQLNLDVEF